MILNKKETIITQLYINFTGAFLNIVFFFQNYHYLALLLLIWKGDKNIQAVSYIYTYKRICDALSQNKKLGNQG